jgi:hypothetical protein
MLKHNLVELFSDSEGGSALTDLKLELGVNLLRLRVGLVALDHVDEV